MCEPINTICQTIWQAVFSFSIVQILRIFCSRNIIHRVLISFCQHSHRSCPENTRNWENKFGHWMICTEDGLPVILPINYNPAIAHRIKEDLHLFVTSNTPSEEGQLMPEKGLEDQERWEHLTSSHWCKQMSKINEKSQFEEQINYWTNRKWNLRTV